MLVDSLTQSTKEREGVMNKLDKMRQVISYSDRLRFISRNLNSIDCRSCNGYHSETQEKRDNNKSLKLIEESKRIAQDLGLKFFHQSDPRGCSVYLIDKDMNDSNYSQGIAF